MNRKFMEKRLVLIIRGRVQGVFFRDSARQKAKEFGLVGWVENEPDGTVKIVAEGKENDLLKLIEWCRQGGPEYAKVNNIEIDWQKPVREFKNFAVK